MSQIPIKMYFVVVVLFLLDPGEHRYDLIYKVFITNCLTTQKLIWNSGMSFAKKEKKIAYVKNSNERLCYLRYLKLNQKSPG